MKYTELEKLCKKQLLSEEQRDAIAKELQIGPFARERSYFLICLASLGGILFLAGVSMLISANWEIIPDFTKQVGANLLTVLFWAVGIFLLFRGKWASRIGGVFCGLGAVMFLLNIILYGYIYQLSSEPWKPLLLWFVGIAAFPWILKLRGVFVLSVLAGFCALGAWSDDYLSGREAVWLFYACFALLAAGGFVLSALNGEKAKAYAPLALSAGYGFLFFFAYSQSRAEFYYDSAVYLSFAAFACLGTLLLFVSRLFYLRRRAPEHRKLGYCFAGTEFLMFSLPVLFYVFSFDGHVFQIASIFAVGVMTMIWGTVTIKKFYVNLGTAFVLFAGIAVMGRLIVSVSVSGVILIFIGLLFLIFAFALSRIRKFLTRRINAQNTDSNL
ncbi:MAG: DUF2157 domain-containing protein [Opitutales bacterium]|nr:DUF2157 domain-containing protein [Opitutales bacterium]